MRRRPFPAPNLTSLLDVLFILIFATLVQLAGRRASAAPVPPAPVPVPVPDPVPVPPPALAKLHDQAIEALADRPPLVVRIRKDGTLTRLETATASLDLDVPLLEHVADPDVAIAYLGDRSADQHLCRIAALHLGLDDLGAYLVVLTADVPLAELPHALYDGLHRDADRCLVEQHGVAVIIDPGSVTP